MKTKFRSIFLHGIVSSLLFLMVDFVIALSIIIAVVFAKAHIVTFVKIYNHFIVKNHSVSLLKYRRGNFVIISLLLPLMDILPSSA